MIQNQYGRFMHHHELYPLLGLKPGQHLPDEGFDKTVQGIRFFCELKSNKGRRSPHRIKIECLQCNRWLPFGRFGQHIKRADHKEGVR